jgi:hypothetical protein
MNSADFEIFYNWNNSNKTNDKIQFRTIQSRMLPLLERKAFTNSEIEEILIAEGYKESLVKEALKITNTKVASEQEVEMNVEAANGVPKKYSDISHKFERVLQAHGPRKFVKLMTQGESPLLKVSRKELETFQKIADVAYENPVQLQTLHAFMQPSIISELAENVCRARKIAQKCTVTKVASGKFQISHNGKKVEASIKPVDSTSDKFAKSNYGAFGFPDEYVILAYEHNSPYSQIKKDLGL